MAPLLPLRSTCGHCQHGAPLEIKRPAASNATSATTATKCSSRDLTEKGRSLHLSKQPAGTATANPG